LEVNPSRRAAGLPVSAGADGLWRIAKTDAIAFIVRARFQS
jgi:hypothetical protein